MLSTLKKSNCFVQLSHWTWQQITLRAMYVTFAGDKAANSIEFEGKQLEIQLIEEAERYCYQKDFHFQQA